jgi:hypothetical protein
MSQTAEEPGGDTIAGIVSGDGSGKRTFILLAWLLGSVAALALMVAILKPVLFPPSLADQVKAYVQLPYDAHITSFTRGEIRGDVDVWFTLPEPKGAGTREAEVWTLNSLSLPPPPRAITPIYVAHKARPHAPRPAPKSGTGKSVATSPTTSTTTAKAATATTSGRSTIVSYSPWTTTVSGTTYQYAPPTGDRKILTYDTSTARYHFRIDTPD